MSFARDRSWTFQNGVLIVERATGSTRPASLNGSIVDDFGTSYGTDPNGWNDVEIDDLSGGQIIILPTSAAAHF